ncbi:MAG: ChaN family lipoprotein [Proteobacteria bacterium]|nr:ChaN family lipoprotein [Pseudomonadota bacterium]
MKQSLTILRLWIAIVIAVAGLGGCASAPIPMQDILPGELFAPSGETVSSAQLVERARVSAYVLLGEGHTVACDHRVQADILVAFSEAGMPFSLGLEMVPVDLQPVLDRFNAGQIDVDDLEQELNWKETWGHFFESYAPVFREAAKRGVPLVALNVPKRVVSAVSAAGLEGVAEADRHYLPARIIPPTDDQVLSLHEEFMRHQGMMTERKIKDEEQRFLLVQSLWDTAMAENAMRARTIRGGIMLILAGSGHVEYNWGIAHRLHVLDAGSGVLSIMPWRGLDDLDGDSGDLFFYCALTHSSRLGFTLEQLPGYAEVVTVAPETKAALAGFLPGDRIETVQGMPVEDLWVLHKAAVQAKKDGQPLNFVVLRGGERVSLSVPLTLSEPEAE